MEELAQPKMDELLGENGLQICLKTLINALEDRFNKKGTSIEGTMVLEGLKGLHKGYCRRYDFKRADHWGVKLRNGVYLVKHGAYFETNLNIMFNINWYSGSWFSEKRAAFEFKTYAERYFHNAYKFIVVRRKF